MLGYGLSILTGFALLGVFTWGGMRAAAIAALAQGKPTMCSLSDTMSFRIQTERFDRLRDQTTKEVKVINRDDQLGIEQVQTGKRAFWVKSGGDGMDGQELMAYLLAEHRWITEETPDLQVKPGDTVIDCGAHVGVFTDKALKLGASKVISVEIDPVNLECLRRNFAPEIAQGRVIVYPKGVWSKEGTMAFTVAKSNSGMGSLVSSPRGETIQVPITTIDNMVRELGLTKINFIKMDIEGAEREALAGGVQTIRRDHPTLMMDFNHMPDDPKVLPGVVHGLSASYRPVCGPCEDLGKEFRPHIMYFR